MKHTAVDLFDNQAFRKAVDGYMHRQKLTVTKLAADADISRTTLVMFLQCDNDATLLTACALANACDLSLDDYRRKYNAYDEKN